MRGQVDPQAQIFSYLSPEPRVPANHPLRGIKACTDRASQQLLGEIEALHSETGRPTIPPERLLKAQLLMALHSLRSDRLFCEMLDYNLLFRWFPDMSLEDAGLVQSNVTRLRERLVESDLAQRFFDAIVKLARKEDLLSSEHPTVDGTLIEAWAGATTDPEAKSARKGKGKEAKPCSHAHALMENRNGLHVDIRVSSALETEPAAAAQVFARQARKHLKPARLSGDKGYHSKAFVDFLRGKGIRLHLAQIEGPRTPSLDARTTQHASYWVSRRKRKRVEDIFDWIKSWGAHRRPRFRGIESVQLRAHIVGTAYNLLRLSRSQATTG